MPKDWSAELSHVSFRCGSCRATWTGAPDLVEPAPDQEHHPFAYFAHCVKCGEENQPQASWERALLKAHQHSTGPRTDAGKAATARNLEGHPTAEEALRTRFNAMKHGMAARTATYFPAKPDRYAFCARCEVDRVWCSQQAACVKQTEIFLLHHAAFDKRDPKVLASLHADLQATLTAMLQMAIQEVLGEGITITQPRVELNREGDPVTLTYLDQQGKRQYIMNRQANPAIKAVTELVTRLGLSMSDLGMTVRAADAEEAGFQGRLKDDEDTRESLAEFGRRMALATEQARDQIAAAQKRKAADPVLVEFQARGQS
ncbi:MAG: hypothetical protein JNK17_02020 [Hydrogenophaga sp.]|nr:hypothetical protein [Hydrogenophaga sp.]